MSTELSGGCGFSETSERPHVENTPIEFRIIRIKKRSDYVLQDAIRLRALTLHEGTFWKMRREDLKKALRETALFWRDNKRWEAEDAEKKKFKRWLKGAAS